MKGSTKTIAAVGAGYVLGRRRHLKMAAMTAAVAAAGSTPVGGMILQRGAKLIGASGLLPALPPEISELVDTVRADLVPASRAALNVAATSRVDALTDAIHERAELVRDPAAAAAETAATAKDTADSAKDTAGKAKRATGKAASTAKGEVLDEDDENENDDEPDDEPVTRVRRAGTRRRATVTRARR